MFKVIIHGKVKKTELGEYIQYLIEPQIDTDKASAAEKMGCAEMVLLNKEWLTKKMNEADDGSHTTIGKDKQKESMADFYKEEKR